MKNTQITALILAAGKGTRMRSGRSKVLHEILGKPMIARVTEALQLAGVNRIGLIVGLHNRSELMDYFGPVVDYVLQREALGTGHAVMAAVDWMNRFPGDVIVVVGDAPLITPELIGQLIERRRRSNAAAVLLSAIYKEPPPYGRVIRDAAGVVQRIVEERDANETERAVKEVSSSHYCFDSVKLVPAIARISNQNAQGEYYLPDVIGELVHAGELVEVIPVDDPFITFGVNTPEDLARAEEILRKRAGNDQQ